MGTDSLIDNLGGTVKVATALGVKPPRVSNWRKRGRIPSEHWQGLVRLATELSVADVTLEALARMDARKVTAAPEREPAR
ncbi:YdaS family helix-turn-helix protein [Xanthobacteraceae bacterium Astr-EGSB]|uniref:carph-isopro domain-containing protein n=1 Tax=Astrobacterium formosum TaxID=3069710 RepID=UPI0027B649B8|nr:YdaS family helix-turn-helix protein [Xanthobacteraceae bacterium Astr-EGSB]